MGRRGKKFKKGKKSTWYIFYSSVKIFGSGMHEVGQNRKNEKFGPPACLARGCAETKTENWQHTGKIRPTTVVAHVLTSDNWDCCPEIACHEPLAQKSQTCFNGFPQLNFPTCIHREGLGKETLGKLKPKHAN